MDEIYSGLQKLQATNEYANIFIDDVKEKIQMTKREEAKKRHNRKITPPKNPGGKWMTWVDTPDEAQPRKKLVKNTEKELLDALYNFYFGEQNVVTLETYYPVWFEYKKSITASVSTMRRHDQMYRKYYKGTDIEKVPLRKLTGIQLTKWAHEVIKKHNLSSKGFQNMKIILVGSLTLAKSSGIIQHNPWDDVIINSRVFRVIHKKPNTERVYLEEEFNALKQELEKQLVEKPDCSAPYALLLMAQLGTRIGETMALKFSDIDGNYIHIQRTERKFDKRLEDGTWGQQYYDVVEHVKTHNDIGDRFLFLTVTAKEIIENIKILNKQYGYSDSDYIFVDADGRMNSRQVACRLERYCKHIGLDSVKSSHAIRRTVASLLSINLPIDEIRRILGHSDERTTFSYIFNPYSEEKTENMIEKSLK